jgi:hypothetical protein
MKGRQYNLRNFPLCCSTTLFTHFPSNVLLWSRVVGFVPPLCAGTKPFVRSVIGPACSGTAHALTPSPALPNASMTPSHSDRETSPLSRPPSPGSLD